MTLIPNLESIAHGTVFAALQRLQDQRRQRRRLLQTNKGTVMNQMIIRVHLSASCCHRQCWSSACLWLCAIRASTANASGEVSAATLCSEMHGYKARYALSMR